MPASHKATATGMACDKDALLVASYSVSRHLEVACIILLASLFGCALPIAGSPVARMRHAAFVYALGKCLAIGVVLGVALVHMLQPANSYLTHPCAGAWMQSHGAPLAYALCLGAFLAVYTIELVCAGQLWRKVAPMTPPSRASRGTRSGSSANNSVGSPPEHSETTVLLQHSTSIGGPGMAGHGALGVAARGSTGTAVGGPHTHLPSDHGGGMPAGADEEVGQETALRVLTAILLEASASVHSVFVGLAVGVSENDELLALTVALVLHQFFEGVAIGATVVEAGFHTMRTSVAFTLIFTFSAPLGACVGIAAMAHGWVNTQSAGYLRLQGILDAMCAGALLYIGVSLLLFDLPRDMARCGGGAANRPQLRRLTMLMAVWLGACVMAGIGWYL